MSDTTDQEARDLARAAIAQISAHEKVCEQVRLRVNEFMERQDDFERRLWTIGGSAYLTLLTLLGFCVGKLLHLL